MKRYYQLRLMNKKYRGIYIYIGKYWKGIYWHFPGFTIRTFLWGINWYNTKHFEKSIEDK